jgi:hypothetical protein
LTPALTCVKVPEGTFSCPPFESPLLGSPQQAMVPVLCLMAHV